MVLSWQALQTILLHTHHALSRSALIASWFDIPAFYPAVSFSTSASTYLHIFVLQVCTLYFLRQTPSHIYCPFQTIYINTLHLVVLLGSVVKQLFFSEMMTKFAIGTYLAPNVSGANSLRSSPAKTSFSVFECKILQDSDRITGG